MTKTLADIRPGMTFGRYEFLAPVAKGGMAEVWAARLEGTRGFSKTVAIKVMLPTVSDDPRFERMFLDEARIASGIRHPNVVEILDLGEEDELLYLVMEWVDGESVSDLRRATVRRERGVPLPIAVRIICDAALGLHAAHELVGVDGQPVGLVHRDVSPQNILVGYDGLVKVIDFGVAKAAGRMSQTTGNTLKGKPSFMSPEQIQMGDVDRRTDIFALGIVTYLLLTGRHPFLGADDLTTLRNILTLVPLSPRDLDASIPEAVDAVVMKALSRSASDRFPTARDMEQALDAALPSALRVRRDAVGRFAEETLGERGRVRREGLRRAVHRADDGDAGDGAEPFALVPLAELRASSVPRGHSVPPPTEAPSSTPVAVASARPALPRPWIGKKRLLVAVLLVGVAAGVRVATVMVAPESAPASSPKSPPSIAALPDGGGIAPAADPVIPLEELPLAPRASGGRGAPRAVSSARASSSRDLEPAPRASSKPLVPFADPGF